MTITVYRDVIQGSEEWRALRCGVLTASEMKNVVTTSKLRAAFNDKARAHLYELAAQRITKYVEPSYQNDDMLRGLEVEQDAREAYAKAYSPVEEIGFVTNDGREEFKCDGEAKLTDGWGFTLGASPDGFVGDEGEIQIKAPRQKVQFSTVVFGEMPSEHVIQVQTGLLVTGRQWCDFVSFHGGMPMVTIRVFADAQVQDAIVKAATAFHAKLDGLVASYQERLLDMELARLVLTERRVEKVISV